MSAKNKLQEILSAGLYNHSGTWEGLSYGKITPPDQTTGLPPTLPADLDEATSARILRGSSDAQVLFPQLNSYVFGPRSFRHLYLGHYQKLYVGFATDPRVRSQGSSGGVISCILIWLLQQKLIKGAVVLGFNPRRPWLTRPFIATTPSEILSAAGSKYITAPINQILPQIESFSGPLAYVGLPHQVQSIRKLQMVKDPAVKKIKYIIGPFFGNSLDFSAVTSLLKSYGINDYRQIKKLSFRHGRWPGFTRIELASGQTIQLPKFYANYLIPFHITRRSLLCTDFTNEFTDISVGDAWSPVYEDRGRGFSTVISRSGAGQRLLERMLRKNIINLKQISIAEAVSMHSHGYDFKKRGAFIRILFLRLLGRPVPDYGYTISGFPASRYLLEIIIDIMFLICSTSPARALVERINPVLIGRLFQYLRKIWKKSTQHIKREGLTVSL